MSMTKKDVKKLITLTFLPGGKQIDVTPMQLRNLKDIGPNEKCVNCLKTYRTHIPFKASFPYTYRCPGRQENYFWNERLQALIEEIEDDAKTAQSVTAVKISTKRAAIKRKKFASLCSICGYTYGVHKFVGHYCPKAEGINRIGWLDTVFSPIAHKKDKELTFNTTVNHPAHYGGKDNIYEAIKVIEVWKLGFNLGNTVKYISRAGKKDKTKTLEDLKKAQWYLSREIENLSK